MTKYDEMRIAGEPDSSILAQMKADGLSILGAIKMARLVFNLSLKEAKEKVAANEHWRHTHRANENLHDQAIALLQTKK